MPQTYSDRSLHEEEIFNAKLIELMYPKSPATSRLTTEELVRIAHTALNGLLNENENSASTITSEDNTEQSLQIDVHKLLTVMLDCSRICGGERYVASAIISVGGESQM